MSGRELSIAYKAITVNELSGDLVAVSGEAVFTGDVDYQGVFYFGVSCLATDAGVLLTKMKIDRVNRSGHSHRSLQMAAMDMERLDEGPALDQFYGVVPVGIIRYDLSGDMLITYMNQAMFDILGYTKEQFYGEVGANLRMIVHPDDLDHLYKKSVEMIETGESERSPIVHQARRLRRTRAVSAMAIFRASTGGPSPRHVHRSGRSRALSDGGRRGIGNPAEPRCEGGRVDLRAIGDFCRLLEAKGSNDPSTRRHLLDGEMHASR